MLYQKIAGPYKRDPQTNKVMPGVFASPELEALFDVPIWTFTEKVDGTNIRVLWDGYRVTFGGRTEKAQLPPTLLAHLEESYGSPEFETILEQTFGEKPAVIFGEGYGPKINGGGIYRGDVSFVGFDVAINGRYLAQEDARGLMAESLNMPVVPRVNSTPWDLEGAIEAFQEHKCESFWGDFRPEGWVGVTTPGLLDRHGSRIVVKVKDVDFPLLTKEANNA